MATAIGKARDRERADDNLNKGPPLSLGPLITCDRCDKRAKLCLRCVIGDHLDVAWGLGPSVAQCGPLASLARPSGWTGPLLGAPPPGVWPRGSRASAASLGSGTQLVPRASASQFAGSRNETTPAALNGDERRWRRRRDTWRRKPTFTDTTRCPCYCEEAARFWLQTWLGGSGRPRLGPKRGGRGRRSALLHP